ncbi:hypothetical protein P879_10440 [Paragonimus westermani]|uniref:Uncharacterized protein n=1 Tax=Paragonimus westermani TaxID=34504 RepID=A0A8T0D592_9TREM|nr:hypothetical protein P879_10440 [Paragonimus westermani]
MRQPVFTENGDASLTSSDKEGYQHFKHLPFRVCTHQLYVQPLGYFLCDLDSILYCSSLSSVNGFHV